MTNHFALGMTKATELTKAGKLAEAMALIQSLLTVRAPYGAQKPDDGVIDGVFTRLEEGAARLELKSSVANSPVAKPTVPGPALPERKVIQRPRTSLRETLRGIAAGGMPAHAASVRQPVPLPVGARFETRTHKGKHGQREYKLYIPAARNGENLPLIVMLHGCTQSPDDFAVGTGMNALAEQHGFLVAYPAQPTGANANKCWNWFKPEDQVRDRGEPVLIAGLTRDILRDQKVDPLRVYIAGLSAGGAAAMIVATAYPDIFSAVGVHSGLPAGAAQDVPQAFSAMRNGASGTALAEAVPTIVIHGLADTTVHPGNGRAVVKQAVKAFGKLGSTTKRGVSPKGRAYRHTVHARRDGPTLVELWEIDGAGHAWAGGRPAGTFTDPAGPDASAEMVRFFLQHAKT